MRIASTTSTRVSFGVFICAAILGCRHPTVRSPSQPALSSQRASTSELYMVQEVPVRSGRIVSIPIATTDEAVKPDTVITDADGVLRSIALDGLGNYYAIETAPDRTVSVVEYPANAQGEQEPARRISGRISGLVETAQLAVNKAGTIAVGQGATNPRIAVFDRMARGDAAPLRVISGPDTGLGTTIQNLAIGDDGSIVVAEMSKARFSLATFAAGANGNVSPLNTILFPANTVILGVTIGQDNNVLVAIDQSSMKSDRTMTFSPTIEEIPLGQSGIARAISPVGISLRFAGIQTDSSGNIYAVCGDPSAVEIVKFSAGATGFAAPELILHLAGMTGMNTDASLAIHQ